MDDMSKMAEKLKPGSFFITFTKGLTSNKFEVLERKRYRMSWGPATVYIHRRLSEDGEPVGPPRLCVLPVDNIPYSDDPVEHYLSASTLSDGRSGIAKDSSEEESGSEDDDESDENSGDDDESDQQVADDDDEDSEQYPDPPPQVRVDTDLARRAAAASSFATMNSPQDSALLRRKRVAQHQHPIDSA